MSAERIQQPGVRAYAVPAPQLRIVLTIDLPEHCPPENMLAVIQQELENVPRCGIEVQP